MLDSKEQIILTHDTLRETRFYECIWCAEHHWRPVVARDITEIVQWEKILAPIMSFCSHFWMLIEYLTDEKQELNNLDKARVFKLNLKHVFVTPYTSWLFIDTWMHNTFWLQAPFLILFTQSLCLLIATWKLKESQKCNKHTHTYSQFITSKQLQSVKDLKKKLILQSPMKWQRRCIPLRIRAASP